VPPHIFEGLRALVAVAQEVVVPRACGVRMAHMLQTQSQGGSTHRLWLADAAAASSTQGLSSERGQPAHEANRKGVWASSGMVWAIRGGGMGQQEGGCGPAGGRVWASRGGVWASRGGVGQQGGCGASRGMWASGGGVWASKGGVGQQGGCMGPHGVFCAYPSRHCSQSGLVEVDPLHPLVTTHWYVVGVELRERGSSHACSATVSTPSATPQPQIQSHKTAHSQNTPSAVPQFKTRTATGEQQCVCPARGRLRGRARTGAVQVIVVACSAVSGVVEGPRPEGKSPIGAGLHGLARGAPEPNVAGLAGVRGRVEEGSVGAEGEGEGALQRGKWSVGLETRQGQGKGVAEEELTLGKMGGIVTRPSLAVPVRRPLMRGPGGSCYQDPSLEPIHATQKKKKKKKKHQALHQALSQPLYLTTHELHSHTCAGDNSTRELLG